MSPIQTHRPRIHQRIHLACIHLTSDPGTVSKEVMIHQKMNEDHHMGVSQDKAGPAQHLKMLTTVFTYTSMKIQA